MKNLIVFLISVLVAFSLQAETVYKKVNPDGSVEFTDTPAQGSKEIKIRKTMTYQAPKLPSIKEGGKAGEKKTKSVTHYKISVQTPAKDATVVGTPDVKVTVMLEPALKKGLGHQIRYELDGKEIISDASTVTFKNVYRGTHTLVVDVVNKDFDSISTVARQIFHMKRHHK